MAKMPLFFFFHGDIHKRIHINVGADVITTWNFIDKKQIAYSYVDVKKNYQRAFTTKEVAQLVRRSPKIIKENISKGNIRAPQLTYSLTGDSPFRRSFYWKEEDIMDLHAFLTTVHIGRPRKDGRVVTRDLPNARELRAMIHQDVPTYIKNGEGELIPTWEATKF